MHHFLLSYLSFTILGNPIKLGHANICIPVPYLTFPKYQQNSANLALPFHPLSHAVNILDNIFLIFFRQFFKNINYGSDFGPPPYWLEVRKQL